MSACRKCNGTGVCQNEIHEVKGWTDELVNAAAGNLFECRECGGESGVPGNCSECNGSGEE
jgi:hypothetical protein